MKCICVTPVMVTLSQPIFLSRAHHITSISHRQSFIMPTTRSTVPVNRSGLQRGHDSQLEPSKRKRSNADEHARKRLKDEINSDIGEEEGELKVKGGRGGKKEKEKKRKNLRFVPIPQYLWNSTN